MGYKIITAASRGYFKFVKAMVKSAITNFPECSIYIDLINMDVEAKEIIDNMGSNCEAVLTFREFKHDNQLKCFCTNRRAELFGKLRDQCDDVLIWVDADSIIRKPCDKLKELMNKCDVAAVVRPRGRLKGRLFAGVIAINNTEAAHKFIKRYTEIMKGKNQWNKVKNCKKLLDDGFTWEVWMSNQRCFDGLCRIEMKNKINFGDLGIEYCDAELTNNGVIWAAKNTIKNSSVYLEELKKYI